MWFAVRCLTLGGALALLGSSLAFASSTYSVATISGPGATITQGEALNAAGDAVGLATFGTSPTDCGFLWQSGTLTALAPAYTSGGPGAAGCAGSGSGNDTAWGINDSGLIAGSSDFLTSVGGVPTRYTQAVTWQGSAAPTSLGSDCVNASGVPGGSQAYAVNAAGTAVGTADPTCAGGPHVDSAWSGTANGIIASGSSGSGGKGDAQGIAINNLGQVLVYYDAALTSSGTRPSAALYPGLATLPLVPTIVLNGHSARAGPGALNDSGVVVGAVASSSVLAAAFSANAGSAVTLPPITGKAEATASAINSKGDVVGASFNAAGTSVATIWPAAAPPATGPVPTGVDLNTLIPGGIGITLQTAVAVNASGQILAAGTAGGSVEWVVLTPPANGVTVSSGNPVAEPASGSVPATFTITLPAASASSTMVGYMTVDGTAKAASSDYTAVPNGSVTIAAGSTSAQVQVQIDAGSGQSMTATKGFQLQLTSSTGAPISPTGGVAPQTITVPGIGGTLSDGSGNPEAGNAVSLSGTATSGQAVRQTTTAGPSGAYQFYADPGTYTITPAPPIGAHGNPVYDAYNCPGTAKPGACTSITLPSSGNLTADFKVISLVVNSTATTTLAGDVTSGICDVTPSSAQQTCTLAQAIAISNLLGGRTIGFDIPGGGVPVISPTAADPLGFITAPTVIDATTQPGGKVELSGGQAPAPVAGLEVEDGGSGSVIRGMVIHGFAYEIQLGTAHDVTIQDDFLGTDPTGTRDLGPNGSSFQFGVYLIGGSFHNTIGGSVAGQGNVISTAGYTTVGIGDTDASDQLNVIQGNQIGRLFASGFGNSGRALVLSGDKDTIGGSVNGAGNKIYASADLYGPGAVVQGNDIEQSRVVALDGATIGGAISSSFGPPPPGNLFVNSDLVLGKNGVVQGNDFFANLYAIEVRGDSNTIGGASAPLGNRFQDNGTGGGGAAIAIGNVGRPASGNVVEHNSFIRNVGSGAVAVDTGVGNEIFANAMKRNSLGINLGGGPFRYNTLVSSSNGPNHLQPYPELLSASVHGKTDVTVSLAAPRGRYTIDLYSQPSCSQDDVTPGEGAQPLGRQPMSVGFVQGTASLAFAPGSGAVTATATAPDGSTSEFSPCLTIGHTAPLFKNTGVTVPGGSLNAQSSAKSGALDAQTAKRPTKTRTAVLSGVLRPFCPPITTRFCAGTIVLRQASNHKTIARLNFKLAPGQLGSFKFGIAAGLAKLLERAHHVKLTAAISAHDGARRARHKSTNAKLTLRLAG